MKRVVLFADSLAMPKVPNALEINERIMSVL